MAAVKVGSLARLGPGQLAHCLVGEREIAVCNVGGTVHAIDGRCPHIGGPLGRGNLDGHRIVCPWHAWEFDCRTGQNDFNPDYVAATYPVTLEGDDILVELPDHA